MRTDAHEKYLLYADDDKDDKEILTEMIASLDPSLEVVTVDGGREVLDFLRNLPPKATYPCFIVLDVNMPQFDGIETLRELKAEREFKNIPVVMFSTSSRKKDIELSLKSGAQDYITKPVHSEDLVRVTTRFSDYCHDLPVQTRQS